MTFSIVLRQQIRRCASFKRKRLIDVFLQRHDRAAAKSAIGRDDQFGLANRRCDPRPIAR